LATLLVTKEKGGATDCQVSGRSKDAIPILSLLSECLNKVVLLYLDQNYASRVAKFLLGQRSHDHFGTLFKVLKGRDVLIPPSPFHVLELRSGYLLPMFKTFYAEFSGGYWVRHWQDVLARQTQRHEINLDDFLTCEGSWDSPADVRPLEGIFEFKLTGGFLERSWQAKDLLCKQLGLTSPSLPFVQLLARLLAFRSQEAERYTRPSDLTDLVMAATVGPYVNVLATDRYLREIIERVGYGRRVYSGRRHEVQQLTADLAELLSLKV
jgi:hypothetical protein